MLAEPVPPWTGLPSPRALQRARLASAPQGGVHGDGDEQDSGRCNICPGGTDVEECQAVGQRRDDESTEHRVDRLAVAAEQARTADDSGGDRVEDVSPAVEANRQGA